MKHPLARALHSAELGIVDVAAQLGVDPKTVQRWLAGRVPYPRHRAALRRLTGWKERDLWPHLARPAGPDSPHDEVRAVYTRRSAIPTEGWHRFLSRARDAIDIVAGSGLLLARDATIRELLRDRARGGVRVRLALADPDARPPGRCSGGDEAGDVRGRLYETLLLLRPVTAEPGVRLRLHDTVLYNSLYRADDEILVNAHTYGGGAGYDPVLHLRRLRDHGTAATYLESIEKIWDRARPPGTVRQDGG